MKYRWRKVTFGEVVDHCRERERLGLPPNNMENRPESERWGMADYVGLNDGTVIAACSAWSGPYSEDTPDTDGDPPEFFIGIPVV